MDKQPGLHIMFGVGGKKGTSMGAESSTTSELEDLMGDFLAAFKDEDPKGMALAFKAAQEFCKSKESDEGDYE